MEQSDLFKALADDVVEAQNAPIFDVEMELQVIIQKRMRSMGMSREQVVDRVNLTLRGTGRKDVTYIQFNKWMAASQANTFPAWIIPGLCWALRFADPVALYAGAIGRTLADSRANILRQKAELDIRAIALEKERKQQEAILNQMVEEGYQNER